MVSYICMGSSYLFYRLSSKDQFCFVYISECFYCFYRLYIQGNFTEPDPALLPPGPVIGKERNQNSECCTVLWFKPWLFNFIFYNIFWEYIKLDFQKKFQIEVWLIIKSISFINFKFLIYHLEILIRIRIWNQGRNKVQQ